MDSLILYTTHCPKCRVLETKLNMKKLSFSTIENVDIMLDKGITQVPVLSVNDELIDFKKAVEWVNAQ